MVEKNFNMLNPSAKLQPSLDTNMVNDNNNVVATKIGNNNNNNDGDKKKPKHNYVKILVEDPFNNRDIILKVTKKQKGVYI